MSTDGRKAVGGPGLRVFLVIALLATLVVYWPVLRGPGLPGGEMSDTIAQGYPFMTFTMEAMREGRLPHWNPYVFCGIPFYSSFSAPVFYPLRGIPMLLFGVEGAVRLLFPLHMLLGGIFAWLFLRSIGTGRGGRLVGALAYALTAWSNTLFYAGHGSKVICWAFLPLLLLACERWSATGRPRFLALGGFALGMQALSSHPQMVIYSSGAAALWTLWRCLGGTRLPLARGAVRAVSGLAVIMVLGAALGAVQLLPGYNFSEHSSRGDDLELDEAASYSLPPEESLTMVFPKLFGYRHGFDDSSISGVPLYFGRLGLRLSSEFVGVSVFLLALLAFISPGARGRPYRWPLMVIAAVGLAVSWGGYTPLFSIMYRLLPFLRKLRAPHMAAFLTTSGIALASGLGFDAIFGTSPGGDAEVRRRRRARFARAAAAFGLLCVVLYVLAGPLVVMLQSGWWERMGASPSGGFAAIEDARVDLARPGFLAAAAAALVVAGTALAVGRLRWPAWVPAAVVSLVLAVELVPLDRDFQALTYEDEVEELFPRGGDVAAMVGGGRLLPGGNEWVPLHVRSVLGYHAAKPAVIEDLQGVIREGGIPAARSTSFTAVQGEGGPIPYGQAREMILEQAAAESPAAVGELEAALPEQPLPRVFFPESWTVMGEDQCLDLLATGLDPLETTVLYEPPPGLASGSREAFCEAELVVRDPEHLEITADCGEPALLVLADTWYPRWRAEVDGEPARILRANHWQRAVVVPEGEHTVTMRFDSSDVGAGLAISLAALLAILLLAGLDLYLRGRRGGAEG